MQYLNFIQLKHMIKNSFDFLIKLRQPTNDIVTPLQNYLRNKFELTDKFSEFLSSRIVYKFTYGNSLCQEFRIFDLKIKKNELDGNALDNLVSSTFNIVIQNWKIDLFAKDYELFIVPSDLMSDKYELTNNFYNPKQIKEVIWSNTELNHNSFYEKKNSGLVSILRKSFVSN